MSQPLSLIVLSLLHYKPLHPYGMQRLIRRWGKDLVVNVGQRTSLHRVIGRLAADGLVAVRDTERDHGYPERTVYELTEAGRRAARAWVEEMLATPKREYPAFAAALSHLPLLSPERAATILERRLGAIAETLSSLEADLARQAGAGLRRAGLLELEFLHAVMEGEHAWLREVVADFRSGALTWTPAVLETTPAGGRCHLPEKPEMPGKSEKSERKGTERTGNGQAQAAS